MRRQKFVGVSPRCRRPRPRIYCERSCGSSSAVEHVLAKDGVASSNLVFRSIEPSAHGSGFIRGRIARRKEREPCALLFRTRPSRILEHSRPRFGTSGREACSGTSRRVAFSIPLWLARVSLAGTRWPTKLAAEKARPDCRLPARSSLHHPTSSFASFEHSEHPLILYWPGCTTSTSSTPSARRRWSS